jgi:hypothetical protein
VRETTNQYSVPADKLGFRTDVRVRNCAGKPGTVTLRSFKSVPGWPAEFVYRPKFTGGLRLNIGVMIVPKCLPPVATNVVAKKLKFV